MSKKSIIAIILNVVICCGVSMAQAPPNYTPPNVTFDYKDYKQYVNDTPGKLFDAAGDNIQSKNKVWVYLPVGNYHLSARLTIRRVSCLNGVPWHYLGQDDVAPELVLSTGSWHSFTAIPNVNIDETLKMHEIIGTFAATPVGGNALRNSHVDRFRLKSIVLGGPGIYIGP